MNSTKQIYRSSQGGVLPAKYQLVAIGKMICIFTIAFIFFSAESVAQKSKKRDRKKTEEKVEITDKDRRLAEQYFTEGEKYFILEDYTKALAFFQKAMEIDPLNAAINYKIADVYAETEEYENALNYAIKAVQYGPDNKYYYVLLADIYTSLSDFANATEVYENLIENIPGTEEYLFQTAALYIYQEKYDEALECYNEIEKKFGVNEQITFQKQNILLKQGKLDQVIEEGMKLIEAYPGEPEYVSDLANKLIANEKYERATELVTKALNDFPNNPVLKYQLAEIYRKTDRAAQARQMIKEVFESPDFSLKRKMQIIAGYFGRELNKNEKEFAIDLTEKLISIHPEEADSYAMYGDLLQSMDSLQAARTMYLKALEINPSNLQAWQNVLDYELRNDLMDDVIEHFEEAVNYFPNQALLYYFGGTAQMIKDNPGKAAQILEQGKRLSSSNLQLLAVFNGQLGDVYYELGDYQKSDEAYEAALDFNPDNDHVLNNYSYFLSLRNEKLDLALEMSSRVVERHPDNPTYLDTHAWVLYNRGEYQEAKKYIERAIKQDENVSGTIIEHYGDILFKLGNVNKAVEQWEKAKKMEVDSEFIDKKIADKMLYE